MDGNNPFGWWFVPPDEPLDSEIDWDKAVYEAEINLQNSDIRVGVIRFLAWLMITIFVPLYLGLIKFSFTVLGLALWMIFMGICFYAYVFRKPYQIEVIPLGDIVD